MIIPVQKFANPAAFTICSNFSSLPFNGKSNIKVYYPKDTCYRKMITDQSRNDSLVINSVVFNYDREPCKSGLCSIRLELLINYCFAMPTLAKSISCAESNSYVQ